MLLVVLLLCPPLSSLGAPGSCSSGPLVSPPQGWNSYDSTVGNHGINESVATEAAHFLAEHLLPLGYEYLTLDSGWFGTDSLYSPQNGQTVDEYGRLLPNATFYPNGFSPLAKLCKQLGLKWGFWIMGGIPRLAVEQKSRILGTNYTVDQIVDLSNHSNCPWNKWLVYGSKRNEDGSLHEGAVAYYDSIAKLYSSWGVDLIKIDCVFGGNYWRGRLEMEQFARSMNSASPKPVLLSLSPGQTGNVSAMAPIGRAFSAGGGAADGLTVMARMTGDFWDRWSELYGHL
jgi:alpha-galactosidase